MSGESKDPSDAVFEISESEIEKVSHFFSFPLSLFLSLSLSLTDRITLSLWDDAE
jgi:hypothetical protein